MKRTKSMIILGVLALVIMSFSGVYANDFDADSSSGFDMNIYYNGDEAWCTYNGGTKDSWEGFIGDTAATSWMDCGPVYCFYGRSNGEAYMACNTRPAYNEYLKKSNNCTYDSVANLIKCSMQY